MKNKLIKGYILLSAVTLGLQACNDDDSYTGNATLSDCITYKNAYDEHAIDSLCFTMRNDVLLFNHRSALVNCDSEGANVQVQTQGNTLIIKEEYLGKQEANCNCMMNLDYAIRNLSHQTYRRRVITPTATLAEFDLKVDEKTEAIITYPRYK